VKVFACDRCHQLVFFENVGCTRCGQALAYLPDAEQVSGIEPAGAPGGPLWRARSRGGARYRRCSNGTEHGVCNWAVPEDDPEPLCRACRLNFVIPALDDPAAKESWRRIEIAKRRLVYALLRLGLPLQSKAEAPDAGLAFSFQQGREGAPVSTGHMGGVITLDVAEADDPFREKVRVQLGEPYRTLLGHFRHEIGHYYWSRLVEGSSWLARCRALFGDERADYAAARRRHYDLGPPADWQDRCVSAYASMHPWEDWAESFAHYLHMADVVETARAHGLRLRPEATAGAVPVHAPGLVTARVDARDFDELVKGFGLLALTLNDLNRCMGLADPYPFVLCPTAVEKLRLVHEVIVAAGAPADAGPSPRGETAASAAP
jgi:hypothetical protein